MRKFVETQKRMLTKRGKNDIIIHQKIYMYCDNYCDNTYREKYDREEYNRQMDVKILANHLIQHFWNTRINGKRIKCTRTKIGKLLTIVQILSVKRNGEIAFDDTIAEETCGTSIPILSVDRYPYDIWELYTGDLSKSNDFFENNSSRINQSDMKIVHETLPDFYKPKPQGETDGSLLNIVEDVFMEFGTYDSYEIGTLINGFKGNICSDGVVSVEKIRGWLKDKDIGAQAGNPIIRFIYNY